MVDAQTILTIGIFCATVVLIMWRPLGIGEYVPTAVGAVLIFLIGIVPLADVYQILGIVGGAAVTILSTIVMSIVLESIGFFRWAAFNLANKARGSGTALFWYINLLCFLMTMFFNNDGSILITTPIIIQTLSLLNLKPHQKIPYFLSGALVATGASAPIGVSNLANLIALKIVGLDLNSYAAMMFIPAMLGILTIAGLLYLYFKKDIPRKIPVLLASTLHLLERKNSKPPHPLSMDPGSQSIDWKMFRICIFIVILTRISFFALAPFGVPTEWPAIIGAVLLIAVRWLKYKEGAFDIIKKTPWHILIFAFSMYVIIFGLHNAGLTAIIVKQLGAAVSSDHLQAIMIMGTLLTVMSNLCNNLPSVMIGTLSLTSMGLPTSNLQVAYLANVLGSDIGALILPMGTLASLMWMVILRKNKVPVTWGRYLRATILIVPVGLAVSLISLYAWTKWFFF